MTEIHTTAQHGFSVEAQTYVRGRPEYPSDLLRWLQSDLDISERKVVVDLGAGTGKFTELLLRTDADVIAVEPVERMRAQFAKRLPKVKLLAGTAEAIPIETSTVDVLVCAQAFHWFATEESLAEFHRVLRPGGRLGLIWNVRDESVDWVAAITKIITPYEGNAPRFHKGDWRKPFSGKYFTPMGKATYRHQHVGTAQEVIVDRCLSISFIAILPPDERSKVADQLNALIASHPALRGRDSITFPYRTEAYGSTRLE
jgi:SAM-dependent methyltransferase